MKILFLVPDLFGPPGGIARYCRLVAKTLCEWPGAEQLDVLALGDGRGAVIDPRYLSGGKFSYRSHAGNRLEFVVATLEMMSRRRYDLVLSGHVALTPLSFFSLANHPRQRRITFIYGIDAWDRLPLHKRLALKASDTVIAISVYTADRAILSNGLDTASLRILHNCLDPSLEATRPSGSSADWKLPFSGRAAVTVSRLSKESGKGHDAIIRALPSVLERVPDLHYVVVGQGDLQPELERLADEFKVSHRTHFFGALSDVEVGRVLAASELYVMPSRFEGFGFVFLEAMAHRLPIIAGNRDASPEVLGSDAGVLVDPDDVPQLAAAMTRVLLDAELRHALARAGSRRLDALFRYDRFKNTLLSVLSEGGTPTALRSFATER